jgi:hypothetical protein
LRTGPRGHFVGVATRVNQPPSSHALVTRVRNLSASILTPAFYTRARLRPGFRLNGHSLPPLAGSRCRHFAIGSLRRIPVCAHVAVSCSVAAARRPAGFTSPGSSRVADLPALFHAGSSMSTTPFRGFSPPSPHDPLESRCPPCRFPPCGAAASRISATGRVRSPSADVVHADDRVAPLLVVLPFEVTSRPRPTLLQDLLSWASIMYPSLRLPLRVISSLSTRALFRVSENRKSDSRYRASLRGVFVLAIPAS